MIPSIAPIEAWCGPVGTAQPRLKPPPTGRDTEIVFPPADSLVGRMREITRNELTGWGLAALLDDAELVVSELVTNAVRHGGGTAVTLRVRHTGDAVRIEVTDGNPAAAKPRAAGPDDESGRGLGIVAAVSQQWGVSSDGCTTWSRLALPPGGTP
ncbi:ATP-binding protein [Streptomyces qinzhouensis]|uniref:ATP-binding protein n=2 Tax=Streptomyces qinzhouensis TaxID=2599401 RepID=A0A5B8JTB1_9ACTN|nr:ATP-binding protein [Streptomyces qinzhouensis]